MVNRRAFMYGSIAVFAALRAAEAQTVRLPLVAILDPGLAAAPSGTKSSRARSRLTRPSSSRQK
jgi:hypothetical protein